MPERRHILPIWYACEVVLRAKRGAADVQYDLFKRILRNAEALSLGAFGTIVVCFVSVAVTNLQAVSVHH